MARRPAIPPPPLMHELMAEPAFAAYMNTPPTTRIDYGRGAAFNHPGLTLGNPWMILVHTTAGTVKVGKFTTYDTALTMFNRVLADTDRTADVTLVSRRVFFAPPGYWRKHRRAVNKAYAPGEPTQFQIVETWTDTLTWPGYEWCPRCRRPSLFRELPPDHHAFRLMPVHTNDEPRRCIGCGIRHVALPPNPDLLMIVETS